MFLQKFLPFPELFLLQFLPLQDLLPVQKFPEPAVLLSFLS